MFLLLMAEVFDLFPSKFGSSASEVTAGGSLLKDRSLELQFFHDHTRTEVEVSINDALEILVNESCITKEVPSATVP